MLRLDVAADETFRRDLLALCKTLMRDIAPQAISEKLDDNEWIAGQVQAFLSKSKNPFDLAFECLKRAPAWETMAARAAIGRYVTEALNERVEKFAVALQAKHSSMVEEFRAKMEAVIGESSQMKTLRRIVREEIRNALGDVGKLAVLVQSEE